MASGNGSAEQTATAGAVRAAGTAAAAPPDLFAHVVTLEAVEDTVLPPSQGQYAHAAFLQLVQAVDPALAALLHDANGRKPFTVSALAGLPEARGGLVPVRRGARCALRFTILEPRLFHAFRTLLLTHGASLTVRLGPALLRVVSVAGTGAGDPGAGAASAAEMAQGESWPELTLQFVTPTAWSAGGDGRRRIEVLPLPGLVFSGLAASWNAWCAVSAGPAHPEVRAYAEASVGISRMRLETRALWFGGRPQIGTVGTATYTLLDRAEASPARWVRVLAEFAFFAGAGYRTTMGMGQVRCLRGGGRPTEAVRATGAPLGAR